MFVFFVRNYGVCNGTKPPSTYIYIVGGSMLKLL
jgi:hypothetical protein